MIRNVDTVLAKASTSKWMILFNGRCSRSLHSSPNFGSWTLLSRENFWMSDIFGFFRKYLFNMFHPVSTFDTLWCMRDDEGDLNIPKQYSMVPLFDSYTTSYRLWIWYKPSCIVWCWLLQHTLHHASYLYFIFLSSFAEPEHLPKPPWPEDSFGHLSVVWRMTFLRLHPFSIVWRIVYTVRAYLGRICSWKFRIQVQVGQSLRARAQSPTLVHVTSCNICNKPGSLHLASTHRTIIRP